LPDVNRRAWLSVGFPWTCRPTGGGKTEAYLGLAAYTMGLRRLQREVAGRSGERGVAVLMRYTLRLLTLQQFQRAAALICACKIIRRELLQRALVLVWPPEQRERDERGRPGVLHAKCAIADAHWLLLSSANVTARAMDVNMELGVLIEGGDLPRLVTAHFDALITEGVLERLV
jgi:hypothetical protein